MVMVLVLCAVLISIQPLEAAAASTRYAYSVGSLWDSGDDFTTNIKTAADIYGTISGYRSYYSTKPTFDYFMGKNAAGDRRVASDIVFLNGHGNVNGDAMLFQYDNYLCYVSIYTSNVYQNRVGLKDIDMSSCGLITFAG